MHRIDCRQQPELKSIFVNRHNSILWAFEKVDRRVKDSEEFEKSLVLNFQYAMFNKGNMGF